MNDPISFGLHNALDHLKHCIVALNSPADLDGLLAAHFVTGSWLERDLKWHVYCDPATWAAQAEGSLHQAPTLAVFGCLLSEQARRYGTIDNHASDLFKVNLDRLQQRRDIFALPNSWALQPSIVLGVALGIKALTEPSLTAWIVRLLEEGTNRPDVPFFLRMICHHAFALLEKSPLRVRISQSVQSLECSVADLALMIWLVKREVVELNGFERSDWLDDAHMALIQRLITEPPYEERSYKAAIVADVAKSYIETRSHFPSHDLVIAILQNFPAAMERWNNEWQVNNEYDVQSLLWLMLRAVFDGLHYEEYLPKLGRSGQRYDIGLPDVALIVEAKYARKARDFQKIVDEIGKDSAQLQPQSVFTGIIVFVYDESCSVEQHDWACRTLESIAMVRRAIIVCAPSPCRSRRTDA